MTEEPRSRRHVPTEQGKSPNISTENQPEGAARRPSDTLDREPRRDPVSGGAIPSNYNPETMTRKGEEQDSRAGREGAGRRTSED
ncbi:hypothetical protein [Sphingobium lignivorans]|uniref:Uncharacterized protein n=1 Tax=Sphingobium lignivorans TaxID=2735886 RepID=A0ABR6NIE6_9SPHN|nr:hypothetical protein [Sphingobium lignivorans]MBB5986871.1 hypothetical protein [Sphingobium lignivorans]